jgi:hypothetical protein
MQAGNALRPSLNPNGITVLDWVLAQIDGGDSRSQVQLGNDSGITKGYVTQIRDRIVGLLQLWCEKRRRVNSDHF